MLGGRGGPSPSGDLDFRNDGSDGDSDGDGTGADKSRGSSFDGIVSSHTGSFAPPCGDVGAGDGVHPMSSTIYPLPVPSPQLSTLINS
jgi:hypothetical protein